MATTAEMLPAMDIPGKPTTPSPPSSSFTFPRPRSPTKAETNSLKNQSPSHTHPKNSSADLKPNAHPYPIKTTATALLSRSNSVSSSPVSRHHYVPTPPSPAPSPAKKDGARRAEYRGHRYSRSLSSSDDMYLPSSGSSTANPGSGGVHGPRALPIPPGVSNNSIASMNAAAGAGVYSGTSPKRWTPAQLAAHLGDAVSHEAGEWVARRGVGGRAFMRMAEEDLAAMGAPASLRPAARALRQGVLQGQLESSSPMSSSGSESGFPFSERSPTRASPTRMSPAPEEGEEAEGDDDTPSRHPRQTPHIAGSASPFTSKHDLTTSPFTSRDNDQSPTHHGGRFRNGRVQGMVRSFESSGSDASEGEYSPERGTGNGIRRTRTTSTGSASGSGFPMGRENGGDFAGSTFRSGSAFRPPSAGSQHSASDEDGVGGTLRPHAQGRALPVRPDGMNLGATVRGPLGTDNTSTTIRALPTGNAPIWNGNTTGNVTTHTTAAEEEMTVEELLALGEPQLEPQGTGGSWRRKGRRVRREADRETNGVPLSPEQDGLMLQHSTGGRPLPARPMSVSAHNTGNAPDLHLHHPRPKAGVHAWEADEGLVGSTVKRVPPPAVGGFSFQEDRDAPTRERERVALEKAEAEREAAARGRERGRAVREQVVEAQKENTALRGMVEEFRMRLEEVERRVGAMERAASSRATHTPPTTSKLTTATPAALTITERLDPRRLLALFGSAQEQEAEGAKSKGRIEDFVGPTTITALPSYVLLVGLGMCAVVLRVLVRRGLGAVRKRP
ncbi:hypothetical protein C8R43DRAFT_1023643 [Mycena crocata]|nr:hypothetical protein C8R43DRAFT_1023643 [Mycena crocata]